jgi:hypothetical protein
MSPQGIAHAGPRTVIAFLLCGRLLAPNGYAAGGSLRWKELRGSVRRPEMLADGVSALLPYAILGTSQTIAPSRALAGLDRQNARENEFIERSDIFIDGLRNAHAMAQAREKMEHQSERLTDYPEVRTRLQAHLRETEVG